MKHEQEYSEPLIVDEIWIRVDGKLIKIEPEEQEDNYEYDTQGQ